MAFARSPVVRLGVVAATCLLGTLLASRANAELPPAVEAPPPNETPLAFPLRPSSSAGSVYTAEGPLGAFRAGPSFGIGAPDGFRLGAFTKWRGLLAGGVAVSLLPSTAVPGIDGKVSRASGEAFARIHPFRGAFFLGVAGGYAQTKGTFSESRMVGGQTRSIETHALADAFYVAPNAGFQWMLPFGMTVGFDVGVQLPVGAQTPTIDASANGVALPLDGSGGAPAEAGRYVATMPVPVIHLLELGFAL